MDVLVEDLLDVGYTYAGVTARLGEPAAAALRREQLAPARHQLAGASDAAASLVRLFGLGEPVSAAALDAALPRCGVGLLEQLGLVSVCDEATGEATVRARLDLSACSVDGRDWWLVSDLDSTVTGRPLRPDHVVGLGGASITVAEWTPRELVRSALDLGTGSGIQALLLSTHAEQVVATDVNDRALELARLNADLNGVSLDIRRSDLFASVPELFDLVVSNPPFVISPPTEERFTYRDGGRAGHALVVDLIQQLPLHLHEGGVAVMLANWELREEERWDEVVTQWLAPTGLDAFVVQRDVVDVASYAETWAADGGHHAGTAAHTQMYGAWMDDFASRDVVAVGFGVLVLQRPIGGRSPWRRLLSHVGPVSHPMGPGVASALRACSWLAQTSDETLLQSSWVLADDVTEARHGRPGAPDPAVIELHQGSGLRRTHRLSTAQAAFVSVCDGTVPALAACRAIAALTDASEQSVSAEVTMLIRELVADGFLLEAGSG